MNKEKNLKFELKKKTEDLLYGELRECTTQRKLTHMLANGRCERQQEPEQSVSRETSCRVVGSRSEGATSVQRGAHHRD